jgi:diguanylate cyclase (GGDEF)-like protein
MTATHHPVVSKKNFVILARFMLLGTILAMTQIHRAWSCFELIFVVAVFGLTNLFLLLQPPSAFERQQFSVWIFGFDTFAISIFIFFLSRHAAELYIAYFLTIFIAAIARSAVSALATSVVSCAVYGLLTLYGRTGIELNSGAFGVRVAFFLVTAVFVGYLAEEVERERQGRAVTKGLLRMTTQMATLFELSNKMVSTTDIHELFRHILEGAARNLDADAGSLMVMGPDGQTLRVEAAFGLGAEDLKGYTLRVGERIAGWVAQQGDGLLLQGDGPANPRFAPYASPRRIQSAVSSPLKIGERILGVINMNRVRQQDPFEREDLDLLVIFANHAAVILDRMLLYKRVEELSRTDQLLDIYNRGAFEERFREEFNRAQRYGRALSLILLDLDNLKACNDQHGHTVGDEALRRVAAALKSCMRKTDFIARYGGDEIAVILPETDLASARQAAERTREQVAALKIPVAEDGRFVTLSFSAGVAEFNSAAMTVEEDLIKGADAALYQAKKAGRNRVAAVPS